MSAREFGGEHSCQGTRRAATAAGRGAVPQLRVSADPRGRGQRRAVAASAQQLVAVPRRRRQTDPRPHQGGTWTVARGRDALGDRTPAPAPTGTVGVIRARETGRAVAGVARTGRRQLSVIVQASAHPHRETADPRIPTLTGTRAGPGGHRGAGTRPGETRVCGDRSIATTEAGAATSVTRNGRGAAGTRKAVTEDGKAA
jgi:hypothetical protein